MSLRLAVKRSLDDAERDELEVRNVDAQLELLRHVDLATLKEHIHPVRKTPFIELPASPESGKRSHRIDVALLLESLTNMLLEPLASPLPDIAGREELLADALRVLGMVFRLGKKEVVELEDFVDATSDSVVGIGIGYSMFAISALLADDISVEAVDPVSDVNRPPPSVSPARPRILALLLQAFDVLAFFARTELDHQHSHALNFTRSFSEHPKSSAFVHMTVDALSALLEMDDPQAASAAIVPQLTYVMVDLMDSFLYIDVMVPKLLDGPELVATLLATLLSLLQDASQSDETVVTAVRMLQRLAEESSFTAMLGGDSPIRDKLKQVLIVLVALLSESLTGVVRDLPDLRVAALQVLIGANECRLFLDALLPGQATILIAYLSLPPSEFAVAWKLADFEHLCVLRLLASLVVLLEANKDARAEFVTKIVGARKGKSALLRRATEAYTPSHVLDNLAHLLLEVLANPKLRKFLSHPEAVLLTKFERELEEALGVARRLDTDAEAQLQRFLQMRSGYRSTQWHDVNRPGGKRSARKPPSRDKKKLRASVSEEAQSEGGLEPRSSTQALLEVIKEEIDKEEIEVGGAAADDSSNEAGADDEWLHFSEETTPAPSPVIKKRRGPGRRKRKRESASDDGDELPEENEGPTKKPRIVEPPRKSEKPVEVLIKSDKEKEPLVPVKKEARTVLGPLTVQTIVVDQVIDVEGSEEDASEASIDALSPPISKLSAVSANPVAEDVVDRSEEEIKDEARVANPEQPLASPLALLFPPAPPVPIPADEDQMDVDVEGAVPYSAPPSPIRALSPTEPLIDPLGFDDDDGDDDDDADDLDLDDDYSSSSSGRRPNPAKRRPARPRRPEEKRKLEDHDEMPPTKRARTPERAEPTRSPSRGVHAERRDGRSGMFEGLVFRISKLTPAAEELAERVVANGGIVLQYTTKHTTHFIATQTECDEIAPPIQAAVKRGLPLVSRAFVDESVRAGHRLPEATYRLTVPAPDDSA